MTKGSGLELSLQKTALHAIGDVRYLKGGDPCAMEEVGQFLYILGHFTTSRSVKYFREPDKDQTSFGVLDLHKMRWKWLPVAKKLRFPCLFLHDDALYMCDLKTILYPEEIAVSRFDLALEELSNVHTTGEAPLNGQRFCGDYLEPLKSFIVFGGGSRTRHADKRLRVLVMQEEKWLEVHEKGKGPRATTFQRQSCVKGDCIYYYGVDGLFVLRFLRVGSGVWSSIHPKGEVILSRTHTAMLVPLQHMLLFCSYDSTQLVVYDPRTQGLEVVHPDYGTRLINYGLTFSIENRSSLGHFAVASDDDRRFVEIGHFYKCTVAK